MLRTFLNKNSEHMIAGRLLLFDGPFRGQEMQIEFKIPALHNVRTDYQLEAQNLQIKSLFISSITLNTHQLTLRKPSPL
jgi:hypothetical protein